MIRRPLRVTPTYTRFPHLTPCLSFGLSGGPLAGALFALIAGAILFIIIVGLMSASVTGYMAGLIVASNSPVSGIGILAIIASSLLLLGLLEIGRAHV